MTILKEKFVKSITSTSQQNLLENIINDVVNLGIFQDKTSLYNHLQKTEINNNNCLNKKIVFTKIGIKNNFQPSLLIYKLNSPLN